MTVRKNPSYRLALFSWSSSISLKALKNKSQWEIHYMSLPGFRKVHRQNINFIGLEDDNLTDTLQLGTNQHKNCKNSTSSLVIFLANFVSPSG